MHQKEQRKKPGPRPKPENQGLAKLYVEIRPELKARFDEVALAHGLTNRDYLEPILESLLAEEVKHPGRGVKQRLAVLEGMIEAQVNAWQKEGPQVKDTA